MAGGTAAKVERWNAPMPALRAGLCAGLVLMLSGCLAETGDGTFRFLSEKSAPAATADPVTRKARSQPLRPVLERTDLARGKVVVVPPRGYCIDQRALRRGLGGGFALIAACNSLTGDFSGADVDPAVMTVQVQPGLLNRELPDAAALATAVPGARVGRRINGDGLTVVHLNAGGDLGLPEGDARHWRGALLINGYLVGLALYAPKGSALAGRRGEALILALAENLLEASPIQVHAPAVGRAVKTPE